MSKKHEFSNTEKDILKNASIFEGLSSEQLDSFTQISRPLVYKKGDIFVKEGEIPSGLFILLAGEAEIFLPEYSNRGDKRVSEVVFTHVDPGTCFGEYSVLDDKEVSASIRAVTDCRLCFTPVLNFQDFIQDSGTQGRLIYKNLLKMLVERLRTYNREIDLLYFCR